MAPTDGDDGQDHREMGGFFPKRGLRRRFVEQANVNTCVVPGCGKTSIFKVGARGYCRPHKANAEKAALRKAHRYGNNE